ncbi:MAG: hypothetical protein E7385_07765 [Ruminococcaceae bacterium]|nr:hypothetical protein [Oscillospiraceae bacterium]
MCRRILQFLIIIIIFTVSLTGSGVQAQDDASYYGDGTTATWEDIKGYLNDLYANLPYISIETDNGNVKMYFNVEMFIDLGLYVYGDPNSITDIGSVNDFKEVENGYFVQSTDTGDIRGEYRYIGLSTSGSPVSNSRFPHDQEQKPYEELRPMKYSDLSDWRKKKYNIVGVNNDAFEPIREIIDSDISPALDFINEGISDVPLRQQLTVMNCMEGSTPLISLFDYGIIYSWDVNGGSIRMFFKLAEDDTFYCYATFVGPVSLALSKKAPKLICDISPAMGTKTYYIKPEESYTDIPICIAGGVIDNYNNLSDFGKRYSFTRDDITGRRLTLNNFDRMIISEQYEDDLYSFVGETLYVRVYKNELTSLKAPYFLKGRIDVDFGNMTLTTTASNILTIITITPSPVPQITPGATMQTMIPTATPGNDITENPISTGSATPAMPTPGPITVNRKW